MANRDKCEGRPNGCTPVTGRDSDRSQSRGGDGKRGAARDRTGNRTDRGRALIQSAGHTGASNRGKRGVGRAPTDNVGQVLSAAVAVLAGSCENLRPALAYANGGWRNGDRGQRFGPASYT